MIVAFDAETVLIADRRTIRSKSGETINCSPFVPPAVVLGSWDTDAGVGKAVSTPAALAEHLHEWLADPDTHVVCHNLLFDYQVMVRYDPSLRALFDQAAAEGRLHDTTLLDLLIGFAQGKFDKPTYRPNPAEASASAGGTWDVEIPRPRSLDKLAWEYCGIQLNKDPAIRLGYGQFLGRPLDDLPPDFRKYAQDDAVATLRVYRAQLAIVAQLGGKNNFSEDVQVRAALALQGLEQLGVRVNQNLSLQLEQTFTEMLRPLEVELVVAGLGRWEAVPKTTAGATEPELLAGTYQGVPKDGGWHLKNGDLLRVKLLKKGMKHERSRPKFSLNTAAIQTALEALGVEDAPRRDDDTVQLEADFWAQEVPPDQPALLAWLKHEKIKKVLSTYLSVYSQTDEIFPRWIVLGPKTGRMAASKPNLQNIPKRKTGIRALFVPHDGYVFTKSDYSAQEMYTLCEAMCGMGIIGPLYRVLTSDKDIHDYAASLVLNKPYPANRKNRQPGEVSSLERQGQKALNFGVPGGLGPRKLAAYAFSGYGCNWTVAEARAKRDAFLGAFTDIAAYLKRLKRSQDDLLLAVSGKDRETWAKEIGAKTWNVIKEMTLHADPSVRRFGLEAERQCTVELPSGRRRAFCRFTEGANCYFQGIASDVTKTACWLCYKAGLRVVMVVHDEIVIESRPGRVEEDAVALEMAMLEAFHLCCPRVGHYAKVEVTKGLTSWGPATDLEGKVLTL
jgi:DNA polymerase I-like protein with 3'-5' exonuclease and polymerase domains